MPTDYSHIEDRRKRVGVALDDLAKRARVPYTRMYFCLLGKLTPEEVFRLEHVLEAAEQVHPLHRAAAEHERSN